MCSCSIVRMSYPSGFLVWLHMLHLKVKNTIWHSHIWPSIAKQASSWMDTFYIPRFGRLGGAINSNCSWERTTATASPSSFCAESLARVQMFQLSGVPTHYPMLCCLGYLVIGIIFGVLGGLFNLAHDKLTRFCTRYWRHEAFQACLVAAKRSDSQMCVSVCVCEPS